MQLKLLSIIALCALNHSIYANLVKKDVEMSITGTHTRALSKENLRLARLSDGEASSWNGAVAKAGQFVQENAPTFMPYFDTISTLNNELLNTLKSSFGYVALSFKNTKDKAEGLSRLDLSKLNINALNPEKLQSIIPALESSKKQLMQKQEELMRIKENLDTEFKKVKNSWNLITKQKKLTLLQKHLDAIDVLLRLALTVQLTISKTINDTNKLVNALPGSQAH